LLALLDEFHKARVLVLGDVMLDRFVYGSVERISPEAPIPVMSVERSADMLGGAGNVARNIAAMGARATLIGVIGDDEWAECFMSQVASVPTIEPRMIVDTSRITTVKTRYVADRQQILRADRETLAPLSADTAALLLAQYEAALAEADVIVLSDYAKGVLSAPVVRSAISIARKTGKTLIVDPKSEDFAKYLGATILTPNKLELQRACGHDCMSDEQVTLGARRILEKGICDAMVVTRGKDGMSVVNQGNSVTHLRTTAREVFDVSGAGDTVVAGLSLGLAAGGSITVAAGLANIAAGIVVGKPGTAVVTTGEMVASLEAFAVQANPAKIFTLVRVSQQLRRWREQGYKVAFTNGCFDLLHPGHVSLLQQAKETADKLIVGLNADLSVHRLKGPGRPVQGEVARATVLASLKSVDAVVIFAEDTPLDLIRALEPDVLVKGADYTVETVVGADEVLARGGKVVLANLVQEHSTTKTLRRVAGLDET
jgi:D-beta-D-heptose 7-phosphate kinase/D-beta-D-heptose 1-phosphate adenosyltransferase